MQSKSFTSHHDEETSLSKYVKHYAIIVNYPHDLKKNSIKALFLKYVVGIDDGGSEVTETADSAVSVDSAVPG